MTVGLTLLGIYIAVTLVVALVSFAYWIEDRDDPEERKVDAYYFRRAPLWPVYLARSVAKNIKEIWKDGK